jgi:hypothetical protein
MFRAQAPPVRLIDTSDPRLHVMRLLRHGNAHLTASTLSRETRDAVWPLGNSEIEFEHVRFVVTNLHATIYATREAKSYVSSDLA